MFVYKGLTTSELVCTSYDHTFVPIIIYCLRLFVVVLQELHCLQNIQYADAHLHMKSIYSQSFIHIASTVNELCVLN